MLNTIERILQAALVDSFRFGQILVRKANGGGFILSHRDDESRDRLQIFRSPEDAVEIAKCDDAGDYRPLKTAPNLRHGWRLDVVNLAALRLALNLFYPGRLAAFAAWKENRLVTTSLRETLDRQTGMYRAAAKITDEQADALVGRFCRSRGGAPGCLRTILWKRDAIGTVSSTQLPPEKFDPSHDQTGAGEQVIPLLCQEACNLLVAEARRVMKGESAT
jgi:sirohydrochlorin cobaltochelatase